VGCKDEPSRAARIIHLDVCPDSKSRIYSDDRFGDQFTRCAKALRVGICLDRATQMGPVVSESQLDTVMRYVEIGKQEGATLLTGGHRVETGSRAEVHLTSGGTKATGNGHREAGTAARGAFSEWQSIYVDFSGKLQRAIDA